YIDKLFGAMREQESDKGMMIYEPGAEYGEELNRVNEKFNKELQQHIDGTLPKGHIYQLGKPGAVLRAAGFPDSNIELSATRLNEKANQANHKFPIEAVENLAEALNSPIGVFTYGNNAKNVIVGLEHNGKQFLVGVHFHQEHRGGKISDIRGLFPKDNAEWLNWIAQGKQIYLDKAKIQTLIDQQRINLAEVEYLDLDSVAKIVENFENPQIEGANLTKEGKNNYWRSRQLGLFGEKEPEGEQQSLFGDVEPTTRIDMRGDRAMADPEGEAANRAIDEYAERLWNELGSLESVESLGSLDAVEAIEERIHNATEELEGKLTEYYKSVGNLEHDAVQASRDMSRRVRAEVSVAMLKRRGELTDAPEASEVSEVSEVSEKSEAKSSTIKTAGGDAVSFESMGGMRKLEDGEFTLVERKFSETGEFGFTGKE
ncbi:MAG: hypothetical protein K2K52_03215, partial [Paramuribaculum sp.]|nr:hypothetical protein [Paramuribaculum sp.]